MKKLKLCQLLYIKNHQMNFIKLFIDSPTSLHYSHFVFIHELTTTEEIIFWNANLFKTIFYENLKNKKFQQGGDVLWDCFIKATFSHNNIKKTYLIGVIIFEKRVHLSTPKMFECSAFSFDFKKFFKINNLLFLKIKKK